MTVGKLSGKEYALKRKTVRASAIADLRTAARFTVPGLSKNKKKPGRWIRFIISVGQENASIFTQSEED